MIEVGARMVGSDPLTGVGPNMVPRVYEEYRPDYAVNATNPHLHNVPLQIAAERGLPALAVWLWFVAALVARRCSGCSARVRERVLAATGARRGRGDARGRACSSTTSATPSS